MLQDDVLPDRSQSPRPGVILECGAPERAVHQGTEHEPMTKEHRPTREAKKKPARTPKEKRAAKKAKKGSRGKSAMP